MKARASMVVMMAVLVLGTLIITNPSISQADPFTITSISVTVGSTTWCDTTSSCSNKIWDLGGGKTLNGGESLILTQTGPTTYNFDTSEGNPGNTSCNSTDGACSTSLTINGNAVALGGTGTNILANNNQDPGGTVHNEAANWSQVGTAPNTNGFGSVYFGYADNIHSGDCADPDNCLPNSGTGVSNLWNGTQGGSAAATYFLGAGVSGTGLGVAQGGTNHCSTSVVTTDCFDAGAILIYNTQTAVPEPSTVLLVATMVIGLAAWSVRRNRKAISLAA